MEQVLINIMRNAYRHTPAGTSVRITISVDAMEFRCTIEDDGPGVPADGLTSLGQRGLRLDERTQGSGLGLAIAQDICDAYGGDLAFEHADLGGLAVTLRLPPARAAGRAHSRARPKGPGGATVP